ncbi:MAG: hypothetical protein U0175_28500 [Caldilineaceae bacterium]
MLNPLAARRALYFRLNSAIAQLDDEQLRARFATEEAEPGWGRNHILEIEQTKVFVKRIPLTDLEAANQFSTRNHYGLPTYYNYGVGSAGFGVFRELVAHIKTTNWVLAGEIENFPLLYHYRITPAMGKHGGVDLEQHQGYVEYWNNSEAVSNFVLARTNANYQVILFLEYIPFTASNWLDEHPERAQMVIDDVNQAINFLHQHDIIHLDAHCDNVVTDGEQAYLSDFGLVLDRSFDLTEEEKSFFDRHRSYDHAVLLTEVGFIWLSICRKLSDEQKSRLAQRYNIPADIAFWEWTPTLIHHIKQIIAEEQLTVHPKLVELVLKYRDIILLHFNFLVAMRRNPKKDTPYDHERLNQLLQETM